MIELIAIGGVVTAALSSGWYLLCRRSPSQHRRLQPQEPELRAELWNLELRRRMLAKHEQIEQLRGEFSTVMACGMTAASLMTEQVITTPAEATVSELRELMHQINTRHVLICQPADHLQGLVSDRDLQRRRGRTAGDIMTADPYTVSPLSSVSRAILLMLRERISCVPVVDRGQLCCLDHHGHADGAGVPAGDM